MRAPEGPSLGSRVLEQVGQAPGVRLPIEVDAREGGGRLASSSARPPTPSRRILWGERVVRSVANLTRRDGEEFLAQAPRVPVRTEVESYPLARANEALERLRTGRARGAVAPVVG